MSGFLPQLNKEMSELSQLNKKNLNLLQLLNKTMFGFSQLNKKISEPFYNCLTKQCLEILIRMRKTDMAMNYLKRIRNFKIPASDPIL